MGAILLLAYYLARGVGRGGDRTGCLCKAWFSCSLNNLDDTYHQLRVLSRILRRNQSEEDTTASNLIPPMTRRAQGLRRSTLRVFAALANSTPHPTLNWL